MHLTFLLGIQSLRNSMVLSTLDKMRPFSLSVKIHSEYF